MAKKNVAKVQAEEGSVTVSRTVLGQTTSSTEKIKVRPFVTTPAHVSCKFGATIPTGDYASVRVDVMVSSPCYVEEIREVFEEVRDLCDELVEKESARLTGEEQEEG
jgi:hypothetical protein